jgi:hypothetical protein
MKKVEASRPHWGHICILSRPDETYCCYTLEVHIVALNTQFTDFPT